MTKTASIDGLQTAGQRKLLDLVDNLRRAGLSSILPLPQLVVCGDQSSGKSSVLEGLVEIPFPRKENLCTRFATEIILRRSPTSSISTKITPDKSRPAYEQDELRAFSKSINDPQELPTLINEATAAMGLDENRNDNVRAFTRDVLSLEVCSPDCPHLTLVDLPGLIHAENKSQSKKDIQLVRELVDEYISNKRTIILAIISAKNDYANQIILGKCRQFDPSGARTLGIITKPDFLRAGSENEKTWIDLAQNRDIQLELGWHMVKNRSDDELSSSFQDRNKSEDKFFNEGSYQPLSRAMVGIGSLRERLSRILENHLTKELPDLKQELDTLWAENSRKLSSLGEKRSTTAEQKLYLMQVSMEAHDILKLAVQGNYESPFFGSIDTKRAVDAATNLRRLRAVIQYLNLDFAKRMRFRGHKFAICDNKSVQNQEAISEHVEEVGPPDEDDGPADEEEVISEHEEVVSEHEEDEPETTQLQFGRLSKAASIFPKQLNKTEAIEWVLRILERSRGRELPGNFNPMLISHLFWEQSQPWEDLALAHIHQVADICSLFIRLVLKHVSPQPISSRLFALKVETVLNEARHTSQAELKKIIKDQKRHPITYNHYYTTTIQKLRYKRYGVDFMNLSKKAMVSVNEKTWTAGAGYVSKQYIDPKALQNVIDNSIQQDMDAFSAEEALESEMAYYKDELKYFIGVVAKQVIERHLVDPLAEVISPFTIINLSDNEIASLAAEPIEVTELRDALKERSEILESGREAFRLMMGGLR